jgi:hypothetical protein
MNEPDRPLNLTCYMWWDIFPTWGRPKDPLVREVDTACLDLMERKLKLNSIAGQECALHGLSHWHTSYPDECERIVDEFLKTPIAREELREYAEAARMGCVQ